jgi:hypothetical protein
MEDHITLYSGTFDGNNKTVSGLYFNGNSSYIGLFGSSEIDGNIKNVGVVDSYFKGNDFVGGVSVKLMRQQAMLRKLTQLSERSLTTRSLLLLRLFFQTRLMLIS